MNIFDEKDTFTKMLVDLQNSITEIKDAALKSLDEYSDDFAESHYFDGYSSCAKDYLNKVNHFEKKRINGEDGDVVEYWLKLRKVLYEDVIETLKKRDNESDSWSPYTGDKDEDYYFYDGYSSCALNVLHKMNAIEERSLRNNENEDEDEED